MNENDFERHSKKHIIYNHLKEIPSYLMELSKAFSGFLPLAGAAVEYRELRKSGASRKYASLCFLQEIEKIPLFISPSENTVNLYYTSGLTEAFGIILFSSGNRENKKK
jgi:hypothetical protein